MILNNHKSAFITFEGIDMSGKSTQFNMLKNFLVDCHPKLQVIFTKEPDKNRCVGEQIYKILNGEHHEFNAKSMSPSHMQAFFIEDRMDNYRDNIIPALQQGKHVLQDRGVASSLSYGSENPKEFYDFMGIHDRIFSAGRVPFIWSDAIIIIDVPAEVAIERGKSEGKNLDIFENFEKLEKVRTNYRAFANMYHNCTVIDGTKDVNDIAKQVQAVVLPLLGIK